MICTFLQLRRLNSICTVKKRTYSCVWKKMTTEDHWTWDHFFHVQNIPKSNGTEIDLPCNDGLYRCFLRRTPHCQHDNVLLHVEFVIVCLHCVAPINFVKPESPRSFCLRLWRLLYRYLLQQNLPPIKEPKQSKPNELWHTSQTHINLTWTWKI